MTSATRDEASLQRPGAIVTRQVSLRPLSRADRAAVRRWMGDPSVIRFTVLVPGPDYAPVMPYPPAAADRYLETLTCAPGRVAFAICVDGHHVGNTGLKDVDRERRRAECFIELGELRFRGRGVGTAAMRALLAYAFDDVGLEELRLGVFEFNEPAIRLYRRLGFSFAGRYGLHWADGHCWEVLAMALDRGTWQRRATAPPSS